MKKRSYNNNNYFNDGRTVFANTVEPKPVSRKQWIVVGTDSKGKNYTLTYPNDQGETCTRIEAKIILEEMARLKGLKLSIIQAI